MQHRVEEMEAFVVDRLARAPEDADSDRSFLGHDGSDTVEEFESERCVHSPSGVSVTFLVQLIQSGAEVRKSQGRRHGW